MRLLVLIAALFAFAPAAVAQDAPPATRVALETSVGAVVIELDPRAPVSSANFLRYVEEDRLDGASFYRAMNLGGGIGLIQGGTQGDPARVLPPIAHEPTSETGLSHVDGAVSMARFDPGTATGDFFIIVGDGMSSLDAGRSDPQGFAVFGRVVEGMEAVRAILTAPRSATEGEGVMQGQMLEPRIAIVDARRIPAAD